jgi:hypothetical protein
MKKFFSFFSAKRSDSTYSKIDSRQIKVSGQELDLEIYGSQNDPLFGVEPISNNIKVNNLQKHIISKYELNIDYKRDTLVLLTYFGLLRTLFMFTNSNTAMEFKKWYELEYLKKNIYTNTLSEIFKFEFPCIYLLYIGNYKTYDNVYKFGRTDNFIRRYKELNKTYDCVFKISILQYIDPEYLSKAENEINKIVKNNMIKIDNHVELITLQDPSEVINKYKEIGSKYSTTNKDMKNKYIELEHNYKLLETKLELSECVKKLAMEKVQKYEQIILTN